MNSTFQIASAAPVDVTPKRRARHGLIEDWRDALGLFLLLAVAAVCGAAISQLWPAPEDNPSRLNELTQRIKLLETQLANRSAAKPQASNVSDIPPRANDERLDQLGNRLKVAEDAIGQLDQVNASTETVVSQSSEQLKLLAADAAALSVRLKTLEEADLREGAKRGAFSASVANLVRAIQSSTPFQTEFDAVAALAPGHADLIAIAPMAGSGLPTISALTARFEPLMREVIAAQRLKDEPDWSSRLWTNMSAIVSWRATGTNSGSKVERIISRAQQKLQSGDLSAAHAELQQLPSVAKRPLTSWLTDAGNRLKAEQIVSALNLEAVRALTAESPGAPSQPLQKSP